MEYPQPEVVRYDTNRFRQESLQALAEQLQQITYPGYPAFNQRLWSDDNWFDPIRLPHGDWETSGGVVPTIPEREAFGDDIRRVDAYGRPLHPWFDEMLTNPLVGVVTGKGFYWNWGPNYTADPIIVRHDLYEPHVLLITRKDTGQWALPGGFIDTGEDSRAAAQREASEEALIDLANPLIKNRMIYQGPMADIRATANAWPETSAYRFDIPEELTRELPTTAYRAGDDANIACWLPVSGLDGQLFGSHSLLVKMALAIPV